MNVPSSPIRIVSLGHANDGTNPCALQAVPSAPIALPTGINDRAEPARPPIRHSRARSLPPGRSRMFARTTGDKSVSSAGAPQSP
jgi:hypothetical protein